MWDSHRICWLISQTSSLRDPDISLAWQRRWPICQDCGLDKKQTSDPDETARQWQPPPPPPCRHCCHYYRRLPPSVDRYISLSVWETSLPPSLDKLPASRRRWTPVRDCTGYKRPLTRPPSDSPRDTGSLIGAVTRLPFRDTDATSLQYYPIASAGVSYTSPSTVWY